MACFHVYKYCTCIRMYIRLVNMVCMYFDYRYYACHVSALVYTIILFIGLFLYIYIRIFIYIIYISVDGLGPLPNAIYRLI